MSEKNISKIIPVMLTFFTMGFVDLTGMVAFAFSVHPSIMRL